VIGRRASGKGLKNRGLIWKGDRISSSKKLSQRFPASTRGARLASSSREKGQNRAAGEKKISGRGIPVIVLLSGRRGFEQKKGGRIKKNFMFPKGIEA